MSLDLIVNHFTMYGFTLRRVTKNKPITKELYADHLLHISNYGALCNFTNIVFENTSGLHCHGVVKIFKSTSLKRFRVRGWNIRLEELYDPLQWDLYLNKNQDELLPDMIDPPDPDDFKFPMYKLF